MVVVNSSIYSSEAHKYPYDWRTKKPTIFRATEQWFASVEGFRQAAMDAIGHVKWVPSQVFVILYRYMNSMGTILAYLAHLLI